MDYRNFYGNVIHRSWTWVKKDIIIINVLRTPREVSTLFFDECRFSSLGMIFPSFVFLVEVPELAPVLVGVVTVKTVTVGVVDFVVTFQLIQAIEIFKTVYRIKIAELNQRINAKLRFFMLFTIAERIGSL